MISARIGFFKKKTGSVPSAVMIDGGSIYNNALTVTIFPVESDGGSPILYYEFRINGQMDTPDSGSAETGWTFNGYSIAEIEIRAVNIYGAGPFGDPLYFE